MPWLHLHSTGYGDQRVSAASEKNQEVGVVLSSWSSSTGFDKTFSVAFWGTTTGQERSSQRQSGTAHPYGKLQIAVRQVSISLEIRTTVYILMRVHSIWFIRDFAFNFSTGNLLFLPKFQYSRLLDVSYFLGFCYL